MKFLEADCSLIKKFFRFLVLFTVIASILIIVFSSCNKIQAEESTSALKQYASITIEPGDSLWSIASEYIDGHYSCLQDYIDELKFINHLSSDTINAYEHLLIPYYIG